MENPSAIERNILERHWKNRYISFPRFYAQAFPEMNTSNAAVFLQQIKQLGEELESVREERDRLQSDMTDTPQNHSEELEELLSKVTSLTEERDRLQSDKTDTPQNHPEELEELLSKVTSLTEERDQLQEILEGVREERNQLKRDIEEMEMVRAFFLSFSS